HTHRTRAHDQQNKSWAGDRQIIKMDADVDPLISDEEIEIRGSTIDEILSKTGSFGRYQKILLLLSILVFSSSVTFQSLITYYAADDPPWRCVNLNISSFCRKGP
uniref:Uncharacterized protein n=1 Tax=Clytia hemisphaerica TaxID=252671 RepID=A0A7M5XK77_9CNID